MYFFTVSVLLFVGTFPTTNNGCHDHEVRDCTVSQWSSWTRCSHDCHGVQTRTRHVIEHAQCGGECWFRLFQSRLCHCHGSGGTNGGSGSNHGGSDKKSSNDDRKDLNGGEIFGICLGCGVLVTICGAIIRCFQKWYHSNGRDSQVHSYTPKNAWETASAIPPHTVPNHGGGTAPFVIYHIHGPTNICTCMNHHPQPPPYRESWQSLHSASELDCNCLPNVCQ